MPFVPTIEPAVWVLAPGFRALSVNVVRTATVPRDTSFAARALAEAEALVRAGGPPWGMAHLAAWDDVFRRFGAKPQRTPCSAQALRERVLKGGSLAGIGAVVDLYNAISLKFALPVGGENVAAYRGAPRLVVADGTETFDTVKNGVAAVEHPDRGEVVWRDETGVTCRRWNWRQGLRTRIDGNATAMWFVLESLPEMPLAALEDAGAELVSGLRGIFGEIQFETKLLKQE